MAVLGGGVIGGTVVAAAIAAGWDPQDVVVAGRTDEKLRILADEHGVATTTSLKEAIDGAGIVVLSVKPQDASAVMDEVCPVYPDGALFVTVAAALPASFYERRLPAGTPVVRTMPNTPSVLGKGVTAIAPGTSAGEDALATVEEMLGRTGIVVRTSESDLDTIAPLSGSGPAYFYAVVEALTDAGVVQGLDRDVAERLVRQTFIGAAALLAESGEHPGELRERVSSKGGVTLAALEGMRHAGLQTAIAVGINAGIARAQEMSEELGD